MATSPWRRYVVFNVNFEHISTPSSSVSSVIVKFEQVIAVWWSFLVVFHKTSSMETQLIPFQANHCVVKSVQIRSYFWSVFSPNTGKYGPEITPYLDAFHAVNVLNGNPVNTSENQKFSYVFRGYRNGALLWNRFTNSSLDSISQDNITISQYQKTKG